MSWNCDSIPDIIDCNLDCLESIMVMALSAEPNLGWPLLLLDESNVVAQSDVLSHWSENL